MVKSRAFQLIAEEVHVTPLWYQVCIFSLSIYLYGISFVYSSVLVLGSFLVNSISAVVLFDSGATCSFVSLALGKWFDGTPRELDCPLSVEIADDLSIQVSRVHHGCIL